MPREIKCLSLLPNIRVGIFAQAPATVARDVKTKSETKGDFSFLKSHVLPKGSSPYASAKTAISVNGTVPGIK